MVGFHSPKRSQVRAIESKSADLEVPRACRLAVVCQRPSVFALWWGVGAGGGGEVGGKWEYVLIFSCVYMFFAFFGFSVVVFFFNGLAVLSLDW